MANVTPTTAAVTIPEVWSSDILRATERNLVMANLVKRYDSDVKSAGDVVHIPNLANLTAADKTAGTAVTFQANTETENTITVDQHKVVPMLIEDISKAQSRVDLMKEYTDKAGYAVAQAVDSSLTGLYTGLSQSTTAGTLTDASIITAIEYLDAADAPRDGRSFVVHSEAMADLRALDKFTRYDATGQNGVQDGRNNGLVANVYGIDVYMSNNIADVTSTTHNLLFQKEAFGLAMQVAPKVETEYSVDHLGTKMAVHTIYGVAELRDTFAVDVQVS